MTSPTTVYGYPVPPRPRERPCCRRCGDQRRARRRSAHGRRNNQAAPPRRRPHAWQRDIIMGYNRSEYIILAPSSSMMGPGGSRACSEPWRSPDEPRGALQLQLSAELVACNRHRPCSTWTGRASLSWQAGQRAAAHTRAPVTIAARSRWHDLKLSCASSRGARPGPHRWRRSGSPGGRGWCSRAAPRPWWRHGDSATNAAGSVTPWTPRPPTTAPPASCYGGRTK